MGTELSTTVETRLVSRELTAELEAWASEAVSLVEVVRLWIFRRALALFILATLLSAALLPTRQAVSGNALTRAVVIAAAVVATASFMLVFSRRSYELLSRDHVAQAAPALVASALISVVFPLHSQLWVPACGALCLVALFVPLRRIVVIDLLVLLGNLAAHAISGDLHGVRPVAVIGLWVGIPFWTILISIANERIVDHILDLCLEQPVPGANSLQVDTWVARSFEALPVRSVSTQERSHGVADRLTSRQKEVMLLLLVGRRNYEIALQLGITRSEVSRLTSRATERAGADSKEQLCAMLASEWWGSGPVERIGKYRLQFT